MKKIKNRYQTLIVVRDALALLEKPHITLESLRESRELMINTGGPHWDPIHVMEYDAILAAIEMLTNPVFIS